MSGEAANGTKAINIRDIPLKDYLKAIEIKNRLGCETWLDFLRLANGHLEGTIPNEGGGA